MINQAYAEVYEIIGYMNKVTRNKIPNEILSVIRDNRDLSYVTKVDKNDIFNTDNISDKAASILIWLDLNYFVSEEEKKEKQSLLSKKISPVTIKENLFDNETPENVEKTGQQFAPFTFGSRRISTSPPQE